MSDLIDRQAALDAVNAYLGLSAVSRTIQNMTSIQEILENLPSAEPRKKGKWIIDGHHIKCNRCENIMCDRDREGDLIPRNFCPSCGADMREGEEE